VVLNTLLASETFVHSCKIGAEGEIFDEENIDFPSSLRKWYLFVTFTQQYTDKYTYGRRLVMME